MHEPPQWLQQALGPGLWLLRCWRPLGRAYIACVEAVYRVSIGAPLFP